MLLRLADIIAAAEKEKNTHEKTDNEFRALGKILDCMIITLDIQQKYGFSANMLELKTAAERLADTIQSFQQHIEPLNKRGDRIVITIKAENGKTCDTDTFYDTDILTEKICCILGDIRDDDASDEDIIRLTEMLEAKEYLLAHIISRMPDLKSMLEQQKLALRAKYAQKRNFAHDMMVWAETQERLIIPDKRPYSSDTGARTNNGSEEKSLPPAAPKTEREQSVKDIRDAGVPHAGFAANKHKSSSDSVTSLNDSEKNTPHTDVPEHTTRHINDCAQQSGNADAERWIVSKEDCEKSYFLHSPPPRKISYIGAGLWLFAFYIMLWVIIDELIQ